MDASSVSWADKRVRLTMLREVGPSVSALDKLDKTRTELVSASGPGSVIARRDGK
jgi:hypothetical protein